MALGEERVHAALARAIANDNYGSFTDAQAHDIAFHMTDWLDDLASFYEFCNEPSSKSSGEITKMLTGFLYHVPNHVAVAAKLYVDSPVRDIFGVGAVETGDGLE
jgi:hypothetical protein